MSADQYDHYGKVGNMAKITRADLLEAFSEMNALELSEFVSDFEDAFGVTASTTAPASPPPGPPSVSDDELMDEQDEFDVILESAGSQKIQVIKELRVITSLGLKESKDLAEAAPVTIITGVSKERAESVLAVLTSVGAQVTVK